MKQNKIMIFFGLSLIFATLMRYIQINYTVDYATGFFKIGFETIGYFMLAAIIAVALISIFFGRIAIKRPDKSATNGIPLSIVSLLPALSIGYEVFLAETPLITNPILSLLLKLTGLLSVIFFLAYGVSDFINFDFPPICTVIPCFYIIIKIICDFTSISSLALISDNILLMGAYCFILLFMLNFAKLYNNIDENTNFRKILATGIGASVLCVSQSIPYFITNISNDWKYNHVTPWENLSLLAFGIFVTTFIISRYSKKNEE